MKKRILTIKLGYNTIALVVSTKQLSVLMDVLDTAESVQEEFVVDRYVNYSDNNELVWKIESKDVISYDQFQQLKDKENVDDKQDN